MVRRHWLRLIVLAACWGGFVAGVPLATWHGGSGSQASAAGRGKSGGSANKAGGSGKKSRSGNDSGGPSGFTIRIDPGLKRGTSSGGSGGKGAVKLPPDMSGSKGPAKGKPADGPRPRKRSQ